MLPRRLGHGKTALANERNRLLRLQRGSGCERRELADRVADHVVGLDPGGLQRREQREAGRDERRLLDLGVDEILERRLETELLEIEA